MKSEWEQIREVLESLRAFEHDRTLDEQLSKKLAGKAEKVDRSGGPMASTVDRVLGPQTESHDLQHRWRRDRG